MQRTQGFQIDVKLNSHSEQIILISSKRGMSIAQLSSQSSMEMCSVSTVEQGSPVFVNAFFQANAGKSAKSVVHSRCERWDGVISHHVISANTSEKTNPKGENLIRLGENPNKGKGENIIRLGENPIPLSKQHTCENGTAESKARLRENRTADGAEKYKHYKLYNWLALGGPNPYKTESSGPSIESGREHKTSGPDTKSLGLEEKSSGLKNLSSDSQFSCNPLMHTNDEDERTSPIAFETRSSGYSARIPRQPEMKHLGRICMIAATPEPGMKGVENGPSTPNQTSFPEVSKKGKVIVPVEMSLEQIGALASQALSSPSAGSDRFIFPEPPTNIFIPTSAPLINYVKN